MTWGRVVEGLEALCGEAALKTPIPSHRAGLSPSDGRTHLSSICHAFVCRRKKQGDQLLWGLWDLSPPEGS